MRALYALLRQVVIEQRAILLIARAWWHMEVRKDWPQARAEMELDRIELLRTRHG
jgi:hypothetical protein